MQFALLLAAADASTLSSLRGGAAPTQLITSAGELQAAPIAEVVDGGAQMAVVASVGGKGAGRALLNALFDTEFDASALGEAPGAWVSGSPSSPGVLLLDTEGAPAPPPPEGKAKPKGAPADACKLASFSFALADAVLVHAPCVAPSADELRAAYEEYFTQHLSVLSSKEGAPPAARTLLVHVAAAGEDGGEGAWRDAAAAAWAAAVAPTELKDAEMGAHFDLEYAALPHPKLQPAEFAAAAAELSARLRSLRGSEYSKDLRPATFGGAAAAAWKSASSALDGQPPAAWLKERFWAARAYEGGYAVGQSKIAPMAKLVGRDKVVVDFGAKAGALVADAMATFDGGVADCGDGAAALIAQRRGRLLKALHADVAELFSKQNRLITVKAVEKYKAGLLNAVARAGKVEEWQLESLRGAAERWCAAAPAPAPRRAAAPPPRPPLLTPPPPPPRRYDNQLHPLFVEELGGQTEGELIASFNRMLTDIATKYLESPAVQLEAIGAMRRKTAGGGKVPRGLHYGLSLVGAVRSKWYGGQGAVQSFVGYTAGLNSAHLMFSNDGNVPNQDGTDLPFFRWQPKLNFDIAL